MPILSNVLDEQTHAYFARLAQMMSAIAVDEPSRDIIVTAMELIAEKLLNGGCLYICGNGGSAALANHLAIDIAKIGIHPQLDKRLKVVSLSSNTSVITAHGNDEGYDTVFVNQIKGIVSDKDIVLMISGSGNSPNVYYVEKYCVEKGIPFVVLCGFDGGLLKAHSTDSRVDLFGKTEDNNPRVCIHVNCNDMQICEDVFSAILHILYRLLAQFVHIAANTTEMGSNYVLTAPLFMLLEVPQGSADDDC